MKKGFIYIVTILSCVFLLSFTNDVLNELQLSEKEAKDAIRDNFIHNGLWVPDKQAIKNIAVAKRAATVKAMGSYIRQYIESEEFSKAYQEALTAAKPQTNGNVQALIGQRLTAIEEELEEMEEKMKGASGSMKKLYETSIDQLKQERTALQQPSHPMHKGYLENLTEETEEAADQRQMEMKYFNDDYPPTVKALVQKRLRHFLDVTATIDFNARLVQQGKFKVFADPALEAKDGAWKRLFRAGPETIKAARDFAQTWLNDLAKK